MEFATPPNFYPKTYKTGINLRLHLFEIRTILKTEAPTQPMHGESSNEIKPELNFVGQTIRPDTAAEARIKAGGDLNLKGSIVIEIFIIMHCFHW